MRTPDGSHWYYLKDGLGSVTALINGSGSDVGVRYAYDPYGNPLLTQGSLANPFRWAGGYFGTSIQLYKFGDRYYDPMVGRWTQPDPIAGSIVTPDTLNPYVYAGDDPVNFVDPSGEAGGCFLTSTCKADRVSVFQHNLSLPKITFHPSACQVGLAILAGGAAVATGG